MRVKFGWWNVSLKQPGGRLERLDNNEARDIIVQNITRILSDHGIDALGLCEVGPDDIDAISRGLGHDFICVGFFAPWGPHSTCDLGLIIRRSKISLMRYEYEPFFIENRVLGLGVSTTLSISDRVIVFILSHWPSRQWLPPRDPDRDTFGAQLRAAHVRIREDTNVQHVVFAGDYNDEPFDEPLFAHLTATRDPSRLMASEFVIYNPFWRALGTHEAYLGAHPKRRVSGSYRYTSGRHTNWYTFDQMMFSREFILGDAWRLCENETGILADDRLVELLYDRANRIDHLPVISVIEAHTK